MSPSPIPVPAAWRAAVLHCLCETDPATKAADSRALHAAWLAGAGLPSLSRMGRGGAEKAGPPDTTGIPGRPARPLLVPPRDVGRRPMNTIEGRAALIHALAHIEFNAINLALDAAWRFDTMPRPFFDDWLKVAAEEALHFSLLDAHLRKLGYAYGDFTAHNSLWEMADSTRDDLLARMALVPRTLEARGLDATPAVQAKLAQAGDAEAAAILDLILRDEVGHVAIGNRWFGWLCQRDGLDPIAIYPDMARRYRAPVLKGPFNLEARRAAGFTDEELAALQGQSALGA
ncbi:MAG: hypothetical protein RL404_2899 [Pseudomonadota bacterium]